MEKILTIEDAKKRIEQRIDFYGCRIEAWKKVERIRKKDGNDFQNIGKNFTNCKIVNIYGCNEFTVYFRTNAEGYTHDYFTIDANPYQEATDTPDKIEKKITETIEKYERYKATAEEALKEIEKQISDISTPLEALKEAIKKAKENDTNYIIGSYIKNYLHILND